MAATVSPETSPKTPFTRWILAAAMIVGAGLLWIRDVDSKRLPPGLRTVVTAPAPAFGQTVSCDLCLDPGRETLFDQDKKTPDRSTCTLLDLNSAGFDGPFVSERWPKGLVFKSATLLTCTAEIETLPPENSLPNLEALSFLEVSRVDPRRKWKHPKLNYLLVDHPRLDGGLIVSGEDQAAPIFPIEVFSECDNLERLHLAGYRLERAPDLRAWPLLSDVSFVHAGISDFFGLRGGDKIARLDLTGTPVTRLNSMADFVSLDTMRLCVDSFDAFLCDHAARAQLAEDLRNLPNLSELSVFQIQEETKADRDAAQLFAVEIRRDFFFHFYPGMNGATDPCNICTMEPSPMSELVASVPR